MAYNTVKAAKVVDRNVNLRALAVIDGCTFITPEISRRIDLMLGIGTMDTERVVDLSPEPVLVFDVSETESILDAVGPSRKALRAIEAEQAIEAKQISRLCRHDD